ncbi:sugar ABC transporter substrate-binding protein [Aeromicrobium tamlense]|uniref:Ribose transport system substrate-binding protein n=1 Tax=Aeromicrobium tamlense TaxID=375541 RepID=A0A8I0KN94_9ACTN|nr:sugar ABC transporter substrate-binding protein [Aeromicrobium tamlense]MBD1272003.1 sugar ABC transporter substrate-binding protein [Aeromicrobium tamlense]NYI38805.1 ribose transport system substrate-binding protein [Aeromicrobium tamlense]
MLKKRPVRMAVAALAATPLLLLAACSEDPGAASGSAADTAEYQAVAEKAMEPVTEFTGPTEGPAAQPGKKVVFLTCGFEAEGCNLPGKAAAEAGKALGWDVKVVDGKFDPRVYSRTIQEAIDDGADGIILDAVSASSVKGQVKAARDAGLVVGSYDSLNEVSESGVSYDVQASIEDQGKAMAAYMIWKTEGATNAYVLNSPEFNAPYAWTEVAQKEIESCSSCELVDSQDFTAGDAATRLPQLAVTAARKDPNLNVMIASYDAAMLAAIPSMKQAGILDQVKVGTFNGVSPALDLIRKGDLAASVGGAMEWGTWAAMDNMNRMLAGEEAVEQNVPIRLITAENIDSIEPGGPWTGDIDYAAEYQKIWDAK